MEEYRHGRYQRAIDNLNEAIRADSENFQAHFALGRAFQQLDEIASALVAYNRAYQLQPDGKTAACLAYCLSRTGFYKDAIAYSDEAIKAGMATAAVFNNRGYSYLRLRKYSESEKDLAKAEQLDDRLQTVLYNRACLEFVKACQHKNEKASIQQGLAYCQRALNVGPETADLDFLAARLCAFAAVQDPAYIERALDYLTKAVQLGLDPAQFKDDQFNFRALQTHPRFVALRDSPSPAEKYQPAARLLDPGE